MFRYDLYRVLALVLPIAASMALGYWLALRLDLGYVELLVLLLGLPAVAAIGAIAAFVAGIERPEEIHEACHPEMCIHKRIYTGKRRKVAI
jgi:hypothetical protein